MRKVKFRGIATESRETSIDGIEVGDWVYGYLAFRDTIYTDMIEECGDVEGCSGLVTVSVPIDPKTVGEFTGLLDKNGVEIYEGDLLNELRYPPNKITGSYDSVGIYLKDYIIQVGFENGCFSDGNDSYLWRLICDYDDGKKTYYEVIGNIYENPELLK